MIDPRSVYELACELVGGLAARWRRLPVEVPSPATGPTERPLYRVVVHPDDAQVFHEQIPHLMYLGVVEVIENEAASPGRAFVWNVSALDAATGGALSWGWPRG